MPMPLFCSKSSRMSFFQRHLTQNSTANDPILSKETKQQLEKFYLDNQLSKNDDMALYPNPNLSSHLPDNSFSDLFSVFTTNIFLLWKLCMCSHKSHLTLQHSYNAKCSSCTTQLLNANACMCMQPNSSQAIK